MESKAIIADETSKICLVGFDNLQQKKFAYVLNWKVTVKRTHNYFYQIQGQMAIGKRLWCDFVIRNFNRKN